MAHLVKPVLPDWDRFHIQCCNDAARVARLGRKSVPIWKHWVQPQYNPLLLMS